MITSLLLTLAMTAGADHARPITIVEDAPTIVIPLAHYDLANAEDYQRLTHRIWKAAGTVCDVTYVGIRDPETVACRDSAVADADAQLGRLLAHRSSVAALTSVIAVTRPGR